MNTDCASGKMRYSSEHAAKVALVGIVMSRNRGKAQGHHERRAYKCHLCHGWHLTSKVYRKSGTISAS